MADLGMFSPLGALQVLPIKCHFGHPPNPATFNYLRVLSALRQIDNALDIWIHRMKTCQEYP